MVDVKTPSSARGRTTKSCASEVMAGTQRDAGLETRLERLQVCVSKEVMERCWDIASLDRVTVASLVEEALTREIRRRENERGEPYPRRRPWQAGRVRIQ